MKEDIWGKRWECVKHVLDLQEHWRTRGQKKFLYLRGESGKNKSPVESSDRVTVQLETLVLDAVKIHWRWKDLIKVSVTFSKE